MTEKNNVGESISAPNASWGFGKEVAKTFSNHVKRSVPLYDAGHDLVCKISDYFLKDESVCYELGVSTGRLIESLANRHINKKIRFIGLDIEEEMISQAQIEIGNVPNVKLVVDDINLFEYEPSDLIIAYYTIQFVPPKRRQDLINRIYKSLNWGGAFIFFEKVRACDARFQDMMTALYTDFKLDQNYTPDEVIAKSHSLKRDIRAFFYTGKHRSIKTCRFC